MGSQKNCPICQRGPGTQIEAESNDLSNIVCDACGAFSITMEAAQNLISLEPEKRRALSCHCRNAWAYGRQFVVTTDNVQELIRDSKYPLAPLQQLELLLVHLSKLPAHAAEYLKLQPHDSGLVYAKNDIEFKYILNIARSGEYVELLSGNQYRLTLKGWDSLLAAGSQNTDSKNVFVAMWFNDITRPLRTCIRAAVQAAGYQPIFADESEYAGGIMDYVISTIQKSKFVISDFTCGPEAFDENEAKHVGGTRGGVYYEAGFARGLGLSVIHTCKDDMESRGRLHFDVEHENTMFWQENDLKSTQIRDAAARATNPGAQNFAERLYDRIVALFGTAS